MLGIFFFVYLHLFSFICFVQWRKENLGTSRERNGLHKKRRMSVVYIEWADRMIEDEKVGWFGFNKLN